MIAPNPKPNPTIHHIAIGTPDVARLARFYRETLGLPEVARHHDAAGHIRSIWVDAGGTMLMLESREHRRPVADAGVDTGWFFVALSGPRDTTVLWSRLTRAQVPLAYSTAYTHVMRDPDGNRVGLSWYPATAPSAWA